MKISVTARRRLNVVPLDGKGSVELFSDLTSNTGEAAEIRKAILKGNVVSLRKCAGYRKLKK